jgi:S1-C subfamily serine protease
MMRSFARSLLALCILLVLPGTAAAKALTPKAWFGFGYTLHNFDKKAPVRQWLYVVKIAPNSPAAAGGLRLQDAIVAIDGKPLRFASASAALEYFAAIEPERVLRLDVIREGSRTTIKLRTRPMPDVYAPHARRNKALAEEVDAKKKPAASPKPPSANQ